MLVKPAMFIDPRIPFKTPDWDEIFPKKQPFNLEIGFGRGEFLTELAKIHPDINFVGIEVSDKYLEKARKRIKRAKVQNAHVLKCDALVHLEALLPQGAVGRIFVNFPDPWWKKRHHKKRLFTPEMIDRMERLLSPDGTIFILTDVMSYYVEILQMFSEKQAFGLKTDQGPEGKKNLGLDWYPPIIRESEYLREGRDIYFITAKLNGKNR